MAKGVVSTGITLSYKANEGAEFIDLTNLQEIPELGGDVDAIEITTLEDVAHTYTDGIKSYGDTLSFKFLYESEQFETLNSLAGTKGMEWMVTLPDDTSCTFGGTCAVKLAGVGVNAALTYTLNIKPNSEMIWG